jgi:hypothetical protein
MLTIHAFNLHKNEDEFIQEWASQIKHFLELYDYECFYLAGYLHVPLNKCVSIANSGPANTFRDQAFLKHILGIKGRDVMFNFGIMHREKGSQEIADAIYDL